MSIPEQPIIDSTQRSDLLTWWTSQEECEAIGDSLPETVPQYIRSEYLSRYGRAGRGRLWAADELGDVGIPWDESKPAARLAATRGGIVIWRKDALHVFALPGFLTDLRLNIVNELGEPTRADGGGARTEVLWISRNVEVRQQLDLEVME